MNLIVVILSMLISDHDAAGLRKTAPEYLTIETAREHIASAELAGSLYGVDPDLLLSIAHHESRYMWQTVTPEEGHKYSCGVMTPEPTQDKGSCRSARASVFAGYGVGAKHLQGWLHACESPSTSSQDADAVLHCALLGYAGGYRLIAICREDGDARACLTPTVFLRRAAWIRSARSGV